MACIWVLLASRTTAERLCGKPGDPYCPEHKEQMDAIAEGDWAGIAQSQEVSVQDCQRN